VIGRAGVLSPDVQVIMSSADVAAMQAPHARGGGEGMGRGAVASGWARIAYEGGRGSGRWVEEVFFISVC
jgi:hypothetical protein